MYKNIGTNNDPFYRFYIIDFGMSTAKFEGKSINRICSFYKKDEQSIRLNKSQDLRLLITDIFNGKFFNSIYLNIIIVYLMEILLKYYNYNGRVLFWGLYDQVIKIEDETFYPKNIIKISNYLIKNIGQQKLNKRTIKKSEYDKLINKLKSELKSKPKQWELSNGKWTLREIENIKNQKNNLLKRLIDPFKYKIYVHTIK